MSNFSTNVSVGLYPRVMSVRAPSLRGRLVMLVLGLVAALAGLTGLALWQAHSAARTEYNAQMLATTRALARVVDHEFLWAEALVHGLAFNPALLARDYGSFLDAAHAATDALGVLAIAVSTPDGMQRMNTGALPEEIAAGLPAPPEVMRVFQTGRTEIGDLAAGCANGQRRIILAVPVRAAPTAPVQQVLSVMLPSNRLSALLVQPELPPGWVATVLDRGNTIVARTGRGGEALGLPAPARLRDAFMVKDEGMVEALHWLDAEPVTAAIARTPVFRYAVAISTPEPGFSAARYASMRDFAGLVMLVAVAALAMTLLLTRRLGLALRRLARPDAAGGGLAELAELGAALASERAARDAAERAARDHATWLEAAQQAAEIGVWEWSARTDRLHWSMGVAKLLGLRAGGGVRPGLVMRRFRRRVLPADRVAFDTAVDAIRSGRSDNIGLEFRLRRADGALRWLRVQGSRVPGLRGEAPRVLGALLDVTARRAWEADREALLRKQEFLAGEIHHRVKNSLQRVVGLLLMQAQRATTEAAVQLRDAAGRVVTFAAVHRRLYEALGSNQSEVGSYFTGLVEDLRSSLVRGVAGRDLRLVAEPGLLLTPERLSPLGIVVTELLTNALKYGAGTVTLRITWEGTDIVVAVEDEGPGFPPGFEPRQSRGLGMRVAMALTREAGATLEIDRVAAGGRVVVRLPQG
jgi:PAS domain S-box-containing protein